MGKFVITKDKAGEFKFNLRGSNGQIILSSEGYKTKTACNKGIESVRTNSQEDSLFIRKTARNGNPYFNLRAKNGQIIGKSEMYSSSSAMENGIRSVKVNARDARLDDLT